jgi:hypothetical protein
MESTYYVIFHEQVDPIFYRNSTLIFSIAKWPHLVISSTSSVGPSAPQTSPRTAPSFLVCVVEKAALHDQDLPPAGAKTSVAQP